MGWSVLGLLLVVTVVFDLVIAVVCGFLTVVICGCGACDFFVCTFLVWYWYLLTCGGAMLSLILWLPDGWVWWLLYCFCGYGLLGCGIIMAD